MLEAPRAATLPLAATGALGGGEEAAPAAVVARAAPPIARAPVARSRVHGRLEPPFVRVCMWVRPCLSDLFTAEGVDGGQVCGTAGRVHAEGDADPESDHEGADHGGPG